MNLRLLVLGTVLVCFTSCLDIFETFDLKDDGSGTYEVKMDMSRGVALLAMMKQGATDKPKSKLDTVIWYKTFTDPSTTLSADEKRVLRNAYTKIHMDEDEGEMYMQMYYPFANGKEFELVQKSMAKGNPSKDVMKSLGSVMGRQMNTPDLGGEMEAESKKQDGLPTNDFSYTLTNGSIVRNVKPSSKPDAPKPAGEEIPPQLKEMMKMTFTTTVNLPRPAKTWKGNNTTVSADKKQLKFAKNMDLDSKPGPEDFNFSVDY